MMMVMVMMMVMMRMMRMVVMMMMIMRRRKMMIMIMMRTTSAPNIDSPPRCSSPSVDAGENASISLNHDKAFLHAASRTSQQQAQAPSPTLMHPSRSREPSFSGTRPVLEEEPSAPMSPGGDGVGQMEGIPRAVGNLKGQGVPGARASLWDIPTDMIAGLRGSKANTVSALLCSPPLLLPLSLRPNQPVQPSNPSPLPLSRVVCQRTNRKRVED